MYKVFVTFHKVFVTFQIRYRTFFGLCRALQTRSKQEERKKQGLSRDPTCWYTAHDANKKLQKNRGMFLKCFLFLKISERDLKLRW